MKKLICIALTLVMTLSLAACGGNETADTQTDKLSGIQGNQQYSKVYNEQ